MIPPLSPTPSATPPTPLTPVPVSTLIAARPDGSEDRICAKCGDYYLLPMQYEMCSSLMRDLCTTCISVMQQEEFDRREADNQQGLS